MPFYPDPWAAERARIEGVIEEALYGVWRAQFPRLRKALVRRRYQLLAEQSAWQERNKGRRRREWRSKADSSAHTLYGVDVDWQAEQEALLADLKPALEAALNSAMFVMLQEYAQVAAGISWETYNAAAADYAKKYSYDLVSQINGSTKQQMGEVIGEWIERGAEFPDLVERVWKLIPGNPYPNIRDRAQLIAATETTRVFADTQAATLKAMGLKTLHWRTAEDEVVCFPAWTMVETETGPMPIQDIQPGVMVWTRHGLRRVKATSVRDYSGAMVTVRAGRYTVTSTADHPYWTKEHGWLEGRRLNPSHSLWAFRGGPRPVLSVVESDFEQPVYNLEVEEHPEFFANGLLVHNCPICAPMGAAEGGEGALGSTETRLFVSPSSGGLVGIPAHPGCRCWAEASTAEMEERAMQLAGPEAGPAPTPTDLLAQLAGAGVTVTPEDRARAKGYKTADETREAMKNLKAEQKALASRVVTLDDKKNALWRQMESKADSPIEQIAELEDEIAKTIAARDALFKELDELTVDKYILVPEEKAAKIKATKSRAKMADTWRKSTEDFGRLIDGERFSGLPAEVKFTTGGKSGVGTGRAFYHPGDKTIHNVRDRRVGVHELGHWLEDFDAEAHRQAVEFLNRRTAGDSVESLATVTGNYHYSSKEKTRKDKFRNPYVGKVYGPIDSPTATEVLSMGFEWMKTDAAAFAAEDPEMFDFIYNLSRGLL